MTNAKRRLIIGGIALVVIGVAIWFGVTHRRPTYQLPFTADEVAEVTMDESYCAGATYRKSTTDSWDIFAVCEAVNALKFQRETPRFAYDGASVYRIVFHLKDESVFWCSVVRNGSGPEFKDNGFSDASGWSAAVSNLDPSGLFNALPGEARDITFER